MQQEEMSFWDHLEELRWTLFRSVLALFVFAIAGFSVMPWLFDNVVMAPCSSDFIRLNRVRAIAHAKRNSTGARHIVEPRRPHDARKFPERLAKENERLHAVEKI